MDYILELDKVSFDYKTQAGVVHAVQDVSYGFKEGTLYAIMGRSGSGKSTLLSLISGLERPCNGKVLYENTDISGMDGDRFRREKIGMIFQSFYLLPQLTALENVEMSMELYGCVGNRKARGIELLEEVGLTEFHGKKRSTHLSGGEQQRVAIARALASNPPIILADEPTGNLDSENSENIVHILKKLAHEENKCVILITHAKEVAEEADMILHMKDGRLVE